MQVHSMHSTSPAAARIARRAGPWIALLAVVFGFGYYAGLMRSGDPAVPVQTETPPSPVASAVRGDCGLTQPVSLSLEGGWRKSPGDPLRVSLCLANGVSADVYVAVTLPDGQTRFITNAGSELRMSEKPKPFLARIPPQSSTPVALIDIAALSGGYPKGDYTLHAVVVPVRADPLDSNNWLGFMKATTGFTLAKR